MDTTDENQYVFNLNLLKRLGVYQILNPETRNIFGYNVYHVVSVFIALPMLVVSILCPFGLYHLLNDITAFILYFGSVNNYLFSCYKMYIIVIHSKDIWDCVDVTRRDFMSYQKYDATVFNNWQNRIVRVMYTYLCVVSLPILIWFMSPCILQNTTVSYRNLDGTYSTYRMNIINLYLIVSSETYNSYFYVFYLVELTIYVGFYFFSILFDILLGVLCFALSCQLETISDGIHSLGYGSSIGCHYQST